MLISPVAPKEVAHNGLCTPQGAEKDYWNGIGQMTKGNGVNLRHKCMCNALNKEGRGDMSPKGFMTGEGKTSKARFTLFHCTYVVTDSPD